MIIKIIEILLYLFLTFKVSRKILLLYQESHYHLSSFKKIFINYYFKSYTSLSLLLIVLLKINSFYKEIFLIIISLFLIIKKDKFIIKLKYTKRIKRLIFLIYLLAIILINILKIELLILLIPFIIFLSSLMIMPIEYLIYLKYFIQAKRKLKESKAIKIAITGSYGKTTTKALLYDVIKDDYISFKSKASYNTLKGITLSINENLNNIVEVAILEMGASKTKDIQKLAKLINPDISIITSIGPQHLETFKSLDNIIVEKLSLLKYTKKHKVLNGDDENIKNNVKSDEDIKLVGLNDYFKVSDIKYTLEGLSFLVVGEKETYSIKSKLLGRHNINNILLVIKVAEILKIKKETIERKIALFEGVDNRLKIENFKGEIVINDSYNSNKIGFINALEVLKMFSSYKVLITPGIVEGGKYSKNINYSLAEKIKEAADMVILIKTKETKYIKEGLTLNKFTNIKEVKTFNEAFDIYKNIKEEKIALIENDISDIYKI